MNLKKILRQYWLGLLLALVFFIRLPSLFEPFTYGDEGIYLTLGQAARKGLVWYRDIHDNKPPLLYLTAMIANNFSDYRLLHLHWSLITILAFVKLAQTLFPKNKRAVILATAAFAIFSSLHNLEGNVANAENFMLLPTILGFWLIFRFYDRKKTLYPWLGAGALFSVAALFKIPAALDFIGALIFLFLLFLSRKKKNIFAFLTQSFFLVLGFLLPMILSFAHYAFKGALKPYLTAAFFQNLPYLSSWNQGASQTGGLPLMLFSRAGLVLLLILGLILFQKKISSAVQLILVWFAFSWFAALLSSRPYPHYLIQILPAFSLSFGFLFPQAKKQAKLVILPLALALIFRLTFLGFHFWTYPNWPYYANFYQYALGLKDREAYFEEFDGQANNLYQTAQYLQTHTLPEDKIFIWGTQPSLYALARRLPVGRYTASYHIIDFNGYQETLQILLKEKPRYLLVSEDEKRPFPSLFNLIRSRYGFEKQIGSLRLYHRLI